mmetsp:Transcript_736/g.1206  ORF Transcript_736/g.1206 Transcript_736/m.1206 type:complete len:586 (-) Transcript_736:240-1997(-)
MALATNSAAFLLPLLLWKQASGAPCSLCEDGSAVTLPDKVVRIPMFPEIICASLDTILPQILPDETSDQCTMARQLSSICGCPFQEECCWMCPDGSTVPDSGRNVEVVEFSFIFGIVPTCEIAEAYLHSFPENDELCAYSHQNIASKCGCQVLNNETTSIGNATVDISDLLDGSGSAPIVNQADIVKGVGFFGSSNREDIEMQYLVSRISCILSIIGTLLVLCDCLRHKRRRKNLYNQIVATMASFDLIYSVAGALGTIPMDANDLFASPGEMGNATTCKIQGWALQWGGFTSLFLNCALATYFLQVIVYSAKLTRLRKMRKWLIGVPVLLGSVVGFASIPFVESGVIGCHLVPPVPFFSTEVLEALGLTSSYVPFVALFVVPGYLVIAYSTGTLIRVSMNMRKVDNNSKRWRFSPRRLQAEDEAKKKKTKRKQTPLTMLRREVFWQSFMYLVALYLTWLIYISVTVNTKDYILSHYGLWTFVFFITGIQGFLNSLVYFRPRIARYWASWRKETKKKKKQEEAKRSQATSEAPSASSDMEPWANIRDIEPAADLVDANEGIEMESSFIDTLLAEEEIPTTATEKV